MNGDTPNQNNPDQEPQDKEPKIIVDSDWKEQVEKEREQAAADTKDADVSGHETVSEDSTVGDESSAAAAASDMPVPPASFEFLVSMLFTQAMTFLGQVPDPNSSEPTINKPYAKLYIDTLEMLEQKTEGQRSDSESTMLSEALHALRMTFVNVKSS